MRTSEIADPVERRVAELFGWGVGLVAHAAAVFVLPALLGPAWEARTRERLTHRR